MSVFKCTSLQSFLEAEDVYIHQLVGLRCCFWEVRKIIRSWFFAILRNGLNDHSFSIAFMINYLLQEEDKIWRMMY